MIELLVGKWRKAPPAHLLAAHRYYWQADVVQICFVFRMIVMKRVINIANITIDSVLFGCFFLLAVLLCYDPSLLYGVFVVLCF